MGATKSLQEIAVELRRQTEELYQEREVFIRALKAFEKVLRQGRRPKRSSLDPFVLLERLLRKGLLTLEGVVKRAVHAIIR